MPEPLPHEKETLEVVATAARIVFGEMVMHRVVQSLVKAYTEAGIEFQGRIGVIYRKADDAEE